MIRRIILSAIAGAVVLILWAFLSNAVLGLRPAVDMQRPTDMAEVYLVLNANMASPGGYIVQSAANDTIPTNDPVYSVRNSGLSHASAGTIMIAQVFIALIACLVAAMLLSVVSNSITSSYGRRVLFVMGIGVLLAIYGDIAKFDIGGYPLDSAVLLALNDLIAWTLVGLAMATILRPGPVRKTVG